MLMDLRRRAESRLTVTRCVVLGVVLGTPPILQLLRPPLGIREGETRARAYARLQVRLGLCAVRVARERARKLGLLARGGGGVRVVPQALEPRLIGDPRLGVRQSC